MCIWTCCPPTGIKNWRGPVHFHALQGCILGFFHVTGVWGQWSSWGFPQETLFVVTTNLTLVFVRQCRVSFGLPLAPTNSQTSGNALPSQFCLSPIFQVNQWMLTFNPASLPQTWSSCIPPAGAVAYWATPSYHYQAQFLSRLSCDLAWPNPHAIPLCWKLVPWSNLSKLC